MKLSKLQPINREVVSKTDSSDSDVGVFGIVRIHQSIRNTEKEINFLEQQIPSLAEAACKSAYWEALNAGLNVICSKGDKLWEISPDGTRRFIKDLDAGVDLPVGTNIKIRIVR